MQRFRVVLFGLAVATANGASVPIPGDAARGKELFESQKCISCHSVAGSGGKSAPDLARASRQRYTPALMASLMWNHAPQMWSAMQRAGIERPRLSEEQAADLFAFFYAFRYFETPGDAGRGRLVFERRKCNECHDVAGGGKGTGPPVASWTSLNDSIDLARAMWNHAPQMRDQLQKRKIDWPRLSGQEMADLVVYARNVPGVKPAVQTFAAASADTGKTLFQAKGCLHCHKGKLALEGRSTARTMADFGAMMWNHAEKMVQLPPAINQPEMRRLVGYLWSLQYFDDPGNASRGEKLFRSKGCVSCHGVAGSGAPALNAGSNLSAIGVVSAVWRHGPKMIEQMQSKGMKWPRFSNLEMNDLLTYVAAKK